MLVLKIQLYNVDLWLMLDRANPSEKTAHLAPPSPNAPENFVDPSPVASSTGTDFTDVDEALENNDTETTKPQTASQIKSPVQTELKVHTSGSAARREKRSLTSRKIETAKHVSTPYPPRSDEDEPPQSVIHAPPGFGRFVSPLQHQEFEC
jgi:hypothetical protein